MDLMDAPVEDGPMPSPADMGVGLDAEKMAAFDAAVTKRRDAEAALVSKNQAEAKTQLAQLETERQTTFQGRMQANREKEQVKMEQMAAENEEAMAQQGDPVDMAGGQVPQDDMDLSGDPTQELPPDLNRV